MQHLQTRVNKRRVQALQELSVNDGERGKCHRVHHQLNCRRFCCPAPYQKYSKYNKRLVKRLKNCAKIIFTAWQIATSLPSAVPRNPYPDVYKEAIRIGQVLNRNVFQFLGVGCLTGGAFNYYYQVLSMTSIVIVTCVGRLSAKRATGRRPLTTMAMNTVTIRLAGGRLGRTRVRLRRRESEEPKIWGYITTKIRAPKILR